LNVLAVVMRKEPTRIGSGSTFDAGCRGYTAVFKARLLRTRFNQIWDYVKDGISVNLD